jgi:hypothetical protein
MTAPHAVPRVRTPWTRVELLTAYAQAWRNLLGGEPTHAALAILHGQAALENAHGASCYNHNTGNVMGSSPSSRSFYLLRAPECGTPGKLPAGAVELASSHVVCAPGKVPYLPAKESHFRAYDTLEEGCTDKLARLAAQWPSALRALVAAVSAADARRFVHGLYYTTNDDGIDIAIPKYATAAESSYGGIVQSIAEDSLEAGGFPEPSQITAAPIYAPIEFPDTNVPNATDYVLTLADTEQEPNT